MHTAFKWHLLWGTQASPFALESPVSVSQMLAEDRSLERFRTESAQTVGSWVGDKHDTGMKGGFPFPC